MRFDTLLPLPWMVFVASIVFAAPPAAAAVKVACVGEHTTHSAHQSFPNEYPAKLQALLGAGYEVKNFGFPRALVLRQAPNAYTKPYEVTAEFAASKAFLPDVVILGPFGKHDTMEANWKFKADFAADLRWLAEQYRALPSKPKVYVALPIAFPYGSPAGTVATGVLPPTRQVATDLAAPVVDLYKVFLDRKDLFSDDTHLTAAGVQAHAAAVGTAVKASGTNAGPGLPDAGARAAPVDGAEANRAVVDGAAPDAMDATPLPESPPAQVTATTPQATRAPDAARTPDAHDPASVDAAGSGRSHARGCTFSPGRADPIAVAWVAIGLALALQLVRGRSA